MGIFASIKSYFTTRSWADETSSLSPDDPADIGQPDDIDPDEAYIAELEAQLDKDGQIIEALNEAFALVREQYAQSIQEAVAVIAALVVQNSGKLTIPYPILEMVKANKRMFLNVGVNKEGDVPKELVYTVEEKEEEPTDSDSHSDSCESTCACEKVA
jgi:hypothetical protein